METGSGLNDKELAELMKKTSGDNVSKLPTSTSHIIIDSNDQMTQIAELQRSKKELEEEASKLVEESTALGNIVVSLFTFLRLRLFLVC